MNYNKSDSADDQTSLNAGSDPAFDTVASNTSDEDDEDAFSPEKVLQCWPAGSLLHLLRTRGPCNQAAPLHSSQDCIHGQTPLTDVLASEKQWHSGQHGVYTERSPVAHIALSAACLSRHADLRVLLRWAALIVALMHRVVKHGQPRVRVHACSHANGSGRARQTWGRATAGQRCRTQHQRRFLQHVPRQNPATVQPRLRQQQAAPCLLVIITSSTLASPNQMSTSITARKESTKGLIKSV